MSTVPRALRRARLWTAGLMTASTVLVGVIGIHLADAQTRPAATQTSSGTSGRQPRARPTTRPDDDGSDDSSATDLGELQLELRLRSPSPPLRGATPAADELGRLVMDAVDAPPVATSTFRPSARRTPSSSPAPRCLPTPSSSPSGTYARSTAP